MNDRLRQRRDARRRKQRTTRIAIVVGTLAVAGLVALVAVLARGGDEGPQLSAAAQAGKDAAVRGGCVGCHGRNGEGVTAPSWIGLYGSTIELEDGSTIVVDDAYLAESIIDPAAKRPAGGWLKMPTENMLDATAVQSIVTYIKALATPATTP